VTYKNIAMGSRGTGVPADKVNIQKFGRHFLPDCLHSQFTSSVLNKNVVKLLKT
jgi:hypothetical protein